jgi:diguanylate cyclase (GGDEF)-like protein
MENIEIILQRLKKNEEIHRKFHQLESKIISILNFKDFFEILLTEINKTFHVPYVWLSVIEESDLAKLIGQLNDSDIIRKRTKYIKKSDFDKCFGPLSAPVLLNKDLEPYSVFFPNEKISPVRSLALAPVEIEGKIVGSLNQGDVDPTRFEPDMDTSSLKQLMLKISLCLSNVTANEKLTYFSYHDPLTGLLNRRAFESALHREFSRSNRHSENLSVCFIDLDSFKPINDTYGHETGDIALKYVAEALESISRKEDIVARFAGDEFVVILPETNSDKAESLMTRLQAHLDRHPLCHNEAILNISLSYGIASTEDRGLTTPDLLLKKADKRLYAIKEKKKKKEEKETTGLNYFDRSSFHSVTIN